MRVNQQALRPKRRVSSRGQVVCKVYFIDHRLSNAFCMRSTKRQDRRGLPYVINYFKNKVCNKAPFQGKVNWAEIYIDGQVVSTYKFHGDNESRTWRRP